MKLAMVRWRVASSGGAERFILTQAEALAERGVELTMLVEQWKHPQPFPGRLIKLPASSGRSGNRYKAFQRSVADAVAAEDLGLIQTHERILTADIARCGDGVHAAWLDRLKRQRPWFKRLSIYSNSLHSVYMETERRMAKETDMIFVAISPLIARELRQWLDVPEARLRTIENGVDLDYFHPPSDIERSSARRSLGIDGDSPVVSFVGSGFERKGAFQLVRSLADPRLREVTALIAGQDRWAQSLIRLIHDLGLADRVIVTGLVSDVRQILHAADIFVLPTLYDAGPNAVLEALASGLPAVTTPDTGVAELIEKSGAGIVSERRPEALADAIHRSLADIAAKTDAALALRPSLDFNRSIAKWLDLYRELS